MYERFSCNILFHESLFRGDGQWKWDEGGVETSAGKDQDQIGNNKQQTLVFVLCRTVCGTRYGTKKRK